MVVCHPEQSEGSEANPINEATKQKPRTLKQEAYTSK